MIETYRFNAQASKIEHAVPKTLKNRLYCKNKKHLKMLTKKYKKET